MKKRKKHSKIEIDNLEITIKYAKVRAIISNDMYDNDEIHEILNAIDIFSREIIIDKTYVAYNNTKYNKHFLTDDGWKKFCRLLIKTKFGKNATKCENEILQAAYYLMILSYTYMCLEDVGFDSAGIYLDIPEKTLYMVEIRYDTYKEYERYPGKWQDWHKRSI